MQAIRRSLPTVNESMELAPVVADEAVEVIIGGDIMTEPRI